MSHICQRLAWAGLQTRSRHFLDPALCTSFEMAGVSWAQPRNVSAAMVGHIISHEWSGCKGSSGHMISHEAVWKGSCDVYLQLQFYVERILYRFCGMNHLQRILHSELIAYFTIWATFISWIPVNFLVTRRYLHPQHSDLQLSFPVLSVVAIDILLQQS